MCWNDSFIKICYILFLFYKFHRKKRSYIEKKRSYTVQCFSTLFCTYVRPLFFSFEWFYNCQFGAYAMGFSHCWKPYCNLTLITSLSVCLCWGVVSLAIIPHPICWNYALYIFIFYFPIFWLWSPLSERCLVFLKLKKCTFFRVS